MTAIDQLIKDMQELKKTKLYASSFKAIDDCIFLANYHKKTEIRQLEHFGLYSVIVDRQQGKRAAVEDFVKIIDKIKDEN